MAIAAVILYQATISQSILDCRSGIASDIRETRLEKVGVRMEPAASTPCLRASACLPSRAGAELILPPPITLTKPTIAQFVPFIEPARTRFISVHAYDYASVARDLCKVSASG